MLKRLFILPVYSLLLIGFACPLFIAGCVGGGTSEPEVDVSLLERDTDCKALLVIAEDRSGSTTEVRKLDNNQYRAIMEQFAENFNGMVAVRIIGNPESADRDFFRLNVEPKYLPVTEPEDANLDEAALARKKNTVIEQQNADIAQKNRSALDSFINNIVIPKIEGYRPSGKKDVTNITDALHHIETLADEPDWADARIMVAFISDGKHDADNSIPAFSPNHPVEVFLVGTQEEQHFQTIPKEKIQRFESVEGLIHYLNSQTCK